MNEPQNDQVNVPPIVIVVGSNYSDKSKCIKETVSLALMDMRARFGVCDVVKVGTSRGNAAFRADTINPLAREKMFELLPGWDGKLEDFGIQCLVDVLEAAVLTRPGVTVYAHPEMGLHPAATVELGTMFIQASKHRPQIVETHSEHIVLRLLKHIRCEELAPLAPHDFAVIYVHPNGRQQRLRVDAEGEFIDRWPNGFFNERMNELF